MNLLDQVAEARRTGDVARLAGTTPYTRFMNIAPENTTGELLTRMRYHPQLIGNIMLPALHGGTIGALLEAAAIFQVLWEVETLAIPKIITITVDFRHSGRPVDTLARAVLTRQGRRVVNVAIEAWQDDRARPIASANAHFLVSPREQDE
ncbi:MAG: PaaI family thioesterase [Reyranellaceae bacterium]